jgi:hypothetical protein
VSFTSKPQGDKWIVTATGGGKKKSSGQSIELTMKKEGAVSNEAQQGLAALDQVTERYAAKGATLEEMTGALKSVRRKFKFKSLTVEQKEGFWYFNYEINPKGNKKGPKTVDISVTTDNYEVVWRKDEKDRTVHVKATLKKVFSGAGRSSKEVSEQGKAAAKGKAGDVGGHIIGHRFVKDQGIINMFPQNTRFNNSAWKKMENEWAAAIKAGHHVDVDIKLTGGTVNRPEKIIVYYEFIDVDTGEVKREKAKIFRNDEFQEFDRISTEEIEALKKK